MASGPADSATVSCSWLLLGLKQAWWRCGSFYEGRKSGVVGGKMKSRAAMKPLIGVPVVPGSGGAT